MITKEENDRLTQIGPGTLMGNLMRRYWQPVIATTALDEDPVQPVRLLGEDLVIYKDEAGRYGLVTQRCAHRGISMAYGIPQENGLRCAYHGWTYNQEGQVVDMPFEPACLPLKIGAYPVQELGGLLFAYLGPRETMPLLPRHELFVRDDVDKSIEMTPLPCNWLNAMDNSLDPVHYEHLHGHYGNYVAKKKGQNPPMFTARHEKIDFDVFRFGIYKRRLMEGEPETIDDWQLGHPILFPNTLLVGDARVARYQIRVPMDDTHTMHFNYNMFSRKPGDPRKWEGIPLKRTTIYEDDNSIVADTVFKQDALGWVGQGPVSDRTVEHLVTSDKGVILYHNMLIEQAEKVASGEEPMGIVREADENEPMIHIRWEEKAKEIYWPGGRPNQYFTPQPDARVAQK